MNKANTPVPAQPHPQPLPTKKHSYLTPPELQVDRLIHGDMGEYVVTKCTISMRDKITKRSLVMSTNNFRNFIRELQMVAVEIERSGYQTEQAPEEELSLPPQEEGRP